MASRSVKKKQEEVQQLIQDQDSKAEIEEEEEEEVTYTEIEKLQDLGINMGDINKLKAGGIFTITGILQRTRKELTALKGISETKVDKILEAAAKLQTTTFMTGTEYMVKRENITRVSTGSKELDKLLGGGVESMSITEAFGEFRTGKTQLAHTLCITSQLPKEHGGGNGKVAYIDTEGTFRPDRIPPIAKRYGLDPEAALDNILFARAYTHEHQLALITEIAAKMVEDHFALLIVDSLTALFRVDFSGRGELSERQQKLGVLISRLTKIADEFNVAVFVTNQVVSDPGAVMFAANVAKPIGGHIVGHACTTRLYLKKGRGENRICKIYDSPSLPESECSYAISEIGIVDSKD